MLPTSAALRRGATAPVPAISRMRPWIDRRPPSMAQSLDCRPDIAPLHSSQAVPRGWAGRRGRRGGWGRAGINTGPVAGRPAGQSPGRGHRRRALTRERWCSVSCSPGHGTAIGSQRHSGSPGHSTAQRGTAVHLYSEALEYSSGRSGRTEQRKISAGREQRRRQTPAEQQHTSNDIRFREKPTYDPQHTEGYQRERLRASCRQFPPKPSWGFLLYYTALHDLLSMILSERPE